MSEIQQQIVALGRRARQAAFALASVKSEQKNQFLSILRQLLQTEAALIQQENQKDLLTAKENAMEGAKIDRLHLSQKVLSELSQGLEDVRLLPDPVGEVVKMWKRPNGLEVGRMRIPLGVIGIIYESRPNVTIEAASLCIKAGNAVILRGGSEAFASNCCLAGLMRRALKEAGLPEDAVQLLQTTDRDAVRVLLQQEEFIDVMIPRGGESLIRFVAEHARMPVLKHYKGVCHVYVDADADLSMATSICMNAKTQRPGVCNAMETMLVHRDVAGSFLPQVAQSLRHAGVELRGCERTKQLLGEECVLAQESDWGEEFLRLCLAVRVVESMDEAIQHMEQHGSQHTEAIVTKDYQRAHDFVRRVQSSLVLVNASTRFNDGFQLGLGAEIGISTSRLHAFGPMGLEELTTTKFFAYGNGQIRT